MKYLLYISLAFFATVSLVGCKDDEEEVLENPGTFSIYFENQVDGAPMVLDTAGNTNYRYTAANGQRFNFSLFGFYVSEIKLEGPDGATFVDPMNVSADAASVKGYYQVLQSNPSSSTINLANVPAGKYNKLTFTIGINEDGVEEGAAGGVLDPANGAWFWNWNSGYINFAMEGTAENSPQPYVDYGGGFVSYEKTYNIHVGGWKNLPADSTGTQNFVNNVKTITIDLQTDVTVKEGSSPMAHITVDPMKLINESGLDFSTTYQVHTPGKGQPFANKLSSVFTLDHVHE
ncbi:MAG: MbnP family protein [Chitinophagales bacterium]|nr:MbnP family protein [Chitinophagales bacterium]